MRQALIALLVVLMMTIQSTAAGLTRTIHDSDTVVGNTLAEHYLVLLATIILFIAALI